MGFEADAPEILFVDLRLRKVWDVLRKTRPDVLYEDMDEHPRRGVHKSSAVVEMKRLSLRTTERLIRLLYYYDYECNFLASVSPTTRSAQYMPVDLRADPQTMTTESLTALNVSTLLHAAKSTMYNADVKRSSGLCARIYAIRIRRTYVPWRALRSMTAGYRRGWRH